MKKRLSLSYKVNALQNVVRWTASVNLEQPIVAALCEALRVQVQSLTGAVFYYPDVTTGQTTCRYEWLNVRGRARMQHRYGVMFTVKAEPLREITLYAGYGDQHPNYGSQPEFTEKEMSEYCRYLTEILQAAFESATNPKISAYHIVTCLELPGMLRVAETVHLEKLGITILPTIVLGKELKRVSAMVITVEAASAETAKEIGQRKSISICAHLSLALGTAFKAYSIKWNSRVKPVFQVEDPTKVTNQNLYPALRWKPSQDPGLIQLDELLDPVLSCMGTIDVTNAENLTNAIYAYSAGLEIMTSQPTLATVAWIASLSPFVTVSKCKGTLHCSECGPLSFKHNVSGEKRSMLSNIAALFDLRESDAKYKELKELLIRVYSHQRSGYVHGAVLRHGEAARNSQPVFQPTPHHPFSELLQHKLDLMTLQQLTRHCLLKYLHKLAGREFRPEKFLLEDSPKTSSAISMSTHVTLPARIPVGFLQ
jgi:hypothetical protein